MTYFSHCAECPDPAECGTWVSCHRKGAPDYEQIEARIVSQTIDDLVPDEPMSEELRREVTDFMDREIMRAFRIKAPLPPALTGPSCVCRGPILHRSNCPLAMVVT